jgi:putative hydrolase of the HAD superfamily
MPEVTALFWDVGGVILSNGWDRPDRLKAAKKFGLDWEEFEDRHDLASPAYETGRITLDVYLQRTVFYRKRDFTRDEFTSFIFAQSEELPESRAVLIRGGCNWKISACHHQQRGARTERTQDPAISAEAGV